MSVNMLILMIAIVVVCIKQIYFVNNRVDLNTHTQVQNKDLNTQTQSQSKDLNNQTKILSNKIVTEPIELENIEPIYNESNDY